MINVDPDGLQRLAETYNQRFNDFVIEENSLAVQRVVSSGKNRVKVYYRCQTKSGRFFDRTTSVIRYSLWEVLSQRLPKEEVGFRLYAMATSITDVLMAIRQQAEVFLTGDDVFIDGIAGEYVQIHCRPKSIGWYGSISLRVTSP